MKGGRVPVVHPRELIGRGERRKAETQRRRLASVIGAKVLRRTLRPCLHESVLMWRVRTGGGGRGTREREKNDDASVDALRFDASNPL